MEITLIRYGELALKKGNRKYFEKVLVQNIKAKLPKANIQRQTGRIFCEVDLPKEEIIAILSKIPGITSFSFATRVERDFTAIKDNWFEILSSNPELRSFDNFKIESKRADKSFEIHSDELSKLLAEDMIQKFPEFAGKVKLKDPDMTFYTEIRHDFAYLFTERFKGVGGLPVGTAGKALALLSGGIDSPVASYMIMKRGMKVDFIYFHAYPFTPEQSKEKVLELARILTKYEIKSRMFVIPFTEIQTEIRRSTDPRYLTLLMRRAMMKIASEIGKSYKYDALITGEALSQVASQTIKSMICSNEQSELFVLRPLIGFDKEETVAIAKKIGTYETSILPYADCCSLFVPPNPIIKPDLSDVVAVERNLNASLLIEKAIGEKEIIDI